MSVPLVDVQIRDHAGIPVAQLGGEIDIANVADVRAQLLTTLSNSAPGLIVDMSRVTYLDSRGVQLLLELSERLQIRQIKLRVVVPEHSLVRRVLLLTHVESVVPFDATLEDALTRIATDR